MSNLIGCLSELVLGHEEQIRSLLHSAKNSKLHHCNLFVGEEGIGKKLSALACAQFLVCEKPKEDKACGFCPSCMRMANEQSESLLSIAPENNQIKLEQANEIAQFFRLGKITKNRIVIVDDVDSFNSQSANSLLKLLEEPPENSYFFLISSRPEKVISTIRSRSQEWRFKPLQKELLAKKSRAEAWQIEASMGSMSRLFEWKDSEKMSFRSALLDLLSGLPKLNYEQLNKQIEDLISSKTSNLEAIELLQMFFRDCIAYSLGQGKPKFFSDQESLVVLYSRLGLDNLYSLVDLCNTIEQDLDLNLDRNMQWQSLCFQMQRQLGQLSI